MLGMSKFFVIGMLVSAFVGIGTKSFKNFLLVLLFISGVRLVWKILT